MRYRWFLLAAPILTSGCGYNQIQRLDESAASAKQQIEVQLQRRADLVPNLVATVKGYAAHEEGVFTQVAQARAGLQSAVQSHDPAKMVAANDQLTSAMNRLMVVAEAYPQLKADQQFLRLQDELSGTENRIAVARNDYNEAARSYNTYIREFPTNLTAKVTGAKPREYFEVTNAAAREAPKVEFGK